MNKSYRYNSKWMPKNFPRDYDAHIYFQSHEFEIIKKIWSSAQIELQHEDIFIGDIITDPIGPHLKPMLEINFSHQKLNFITKWLEVHRSSLNILIHQVTNDQIKDHTEHVFWLGQEEKLDLSKL